MSIAALKMENKSPMKISQPKIRKAVLKVQQQHFFASAIVQDFVGTVVTAPTKIMLLILLFVLIIINFNTGNFHVVRRFLYNPFLHNKHNK